ncbi:M48 family metallopeptidase [Sphingomonas ursincola]|uniref:M48 family metallopeptidase n=1 Tax=Sphingomonas ursincola TaxID=56361 RepID=UPI002357124D|nr:M48 family metallopeptidase [Sphingomonas ursincola]MBY0620035.1 M48 family metallopeptidase [Sphingomonas ursincola]
MAFDPEAATRAYIDGLGAEALAKSAAYTASSEWMILGGLVVTLVITVILVRLQLTDRIWARLARRGWALRTLLTVAGFSVASTVIGLPWTIYADWWHEKSYGLTSQPLGDFLSQGAIAMTISTVMGSLFLLGVYALMRRTGRTWWLWSAGFAAAAVSAGLLLAPTLIEPLFNQYKPIPEGPVREAVLDMAKQVDIPADRIFIYDGSRQSNNFTANVSGIGSAARIAISDVALKQASLDEVRAVTGHEIGHYVLGHVWRSVGVLSGLVILLFFLADRLHPRLAKALGSPTTEISDPRGLPVLMLVLSILGTLAMPVTNALTRIGESEADAYSLQMVNLPDALAGALVKTAEYRYPRPHPLQEMLFYTHPSVERRVRSAMEWKAKHPAGKPATAPANP